MDMDVLAESEVNVSALDPHDCIAQYDYGNGDFDDTTTQKDDATKDYANVCRSNRRDLINITHHDAVSDLISDTPVVPRSTHVRK